VSDPYQAQIDALNKQHDIGQAWTAYVYDQWLPQQLAKIGGGRSPGYAAPDLGSFRGLLGSPNAREKGAATNYFDSILGGAANQGAAYTPPNYGRLGNLAQLDFARGAEHDYRSSLDNLMAEQAQYEAQQQQGQTDYIRQIGMAVASGQLTPQQAQSLYALAGQGGEWNPAALSSLVPGQAAGLDDADRANIANTTVTALSEFIKGHPWATGGQTATFDLANPQMQGVAAANVRSILQAQLFALDPAHKDEIAQEIDNVIARYFGQSALGGFASVQPTVAGPYGGGFGGGSGGGGAS
jgi:hypothetical protein